MEPTEIPIRAPETKIMETYEAFRQANDESLAEGQRKAAPDILLEEKVERIGRELDRLSMNAQRPPLAGAGAALSPERLEHKRAFDA